MSVLTQNHDKLRSEWSTLETQWKSARRQWRDNVADRFEKQFWQPMEDCIPQLLRTIDEVEETLKQARKSLDR